METRTVDNGRLLDRRATRSFKYSENDPDYKGRALDQNLKYGVIENRSCTDCLFCLLFILLWAGMIISASVGFNKGDPRKMLSPFDASGNQCGLTEGYEDYNKIYFPRTTDIKYSVCVRECPKSANLTKVDCKTNTVVTSCEKGSGFEIYPT